MARKGKSGHYLDPDYEAMMNTLELTPDERGATLLDEVNSIDDTGGVEFESEDTDEVDVLDSQTAYDNWLVKRNTTMPGGKRIIGSGYAISGGGKQDYMGYQFKQKCRHKAVHVMTIGDDDDGVQYYAASDMYEDEFKNGVRISLLGRTVDHAFTKLAKKPKGVPSGRVSGAGPFKQLEKHDQVETPKTPIVLSIRWPDFGLPPVQNTFWLQLHNTLKAQGIRRVQVNCHGGHGRTGTFLAAILIAVCHDSAKAAIDYVHDKYCEEAIEGKEQEAYLKDLAKWVKKNS